MAVNQSFTSAVEVDWGWTSLREVVSVSLLCTSPPPCTTWAACRASSPAQYSVVPSRSGAQSAPSVIVSPITDLVGPSHPEVQLTPSFSDSPVTDLVGPSRPEVQLTPSVSVSPVTDLVGPSRPWAQVVSSSLFSEILVLPSPASNQLETTSMTVKISRFHFFILPQPYNLQPRTSS